ncbi:MAG: hypothetical protein AAGF23_03815, partial [Acidobacteriota bacterium]
MVAKNPKTPAPTARAATTHRQTADDSHLRETWGHLLDDGPEADDGQGPWATGLDADGKYPIDPVPPSVVSSVSANYSVPDVRVRAAVELVIEALDDELDLLR